MSRFDRSESKTLLPTPGRKDTFNVIVMPNTSSGYVPLRRADYIARRRIDGSATRIDIEGNPDHYRIATIKSSEHHFDHGIASNPPRISFRVPYSVEFHDIWQLFKHHWAYSGVYARDCFRSSYGVFCNPPHVGRSSRDPVVARNCIPHWPAFTDLTKWRKTSYTAFNLCHYSIGSEYDTVGSDQSHNGSTLGQHSKNSQYGHCEPSLMRRNDKGQRWSQINTYAPEMVDIIAGADIDVSCDGKHWLHLFGSYCLKHEDPFYAHQSPQSRGR